MFFVTAVAARQVPDPVHRLLLVGDTGHITSADHPTLLLLSRLAADDTAATVVFLGDNVYGSGLLPEDHPDRPDSERRLRSQLEVVRTFAGRVYFIPGNHDWNRSGPDGASAVARQEAFVETTLGRGNSFLPDDGLPGPVVVDLFPGPVLIVLDSEWYLRTLDKPFGESGRYEIDDEEDLFPALADAVRRSDNRQLVVAAHHPLWSLGPHGGFFSFKTHVFPLTAIWKGAYLPLPLVGSVISLAVGLVGGPQDLASIRYSAYRHAVESILRTRSGFTAYVSGHDHSLQVQRKANVFHVVSGSGSEGTHVARGRGSRFTSSEIGLTEIAFLRDGRVRYRAWATSRPEVPLYEFDMTEPEDVRQTRARQVRESARGGGTIGTGGDSVTVPATSTLRTSSWWRLLMGSHHRAAWRRPVRLPVFDIAERGLAATGRGGGLQTLSIRLEDRAGREYVLRSLDKNPSRTLPEILAGTIATSIVQDQVSILHPYGALLVPPLAEAAGLYHSNPRVVFVPRDERFGPYEADVADRLMLFEERPTGDMSQVPGFGGSRDVIGATKMFREVNADNDHRVDEAFFARNRLFDMLIADWDRHEDQWRWATFDGPDRRGKRYRPIGRDRDWAFNRMDGLFPSLVKIVMPKFQSFTLDYGYLPGLNRNGMRQDRRFTAELSRQDWEREAEAIVTALDDSTIARALDAWPLEMRRLQGSDFAGTLAARRRGLVHVAGEYYRILSRQVDVVGSDKHERFQVVRLDRDRTGVTVETITREGVVRDTMYQRVFDVVETEEIRLYGLDGDDRFVVRGVAEGHSVFVVGGRGDDTLEDVTPADVQRHGRVRVFDRSDGMSVAAGPATADRRSSDPSANRYDPSDFLVPYVQPRLFFGSNPDDGVFVGGGASWTRGGFRKQPFASRRTLVANVAGRTGAFNALYSDRRVGLIAGWDLATRLEARTPRNIRNFFGLGNETINEAEESEFYQARLSSVLASIGIERSLGGRVRFGVRSLLSRTDVVHDPDRFLSTPQAGVDPASLRDHWYVGGDVTLRIDLRDSDLYPTRGFLWKSTAGTRRGFSHDAPTYGRLESDLSLFQTLGYDGPLTFAVRGGLEHNDGPFPFYQASSLGGRSNLRGFRGTRFAGRTAVYQNFEARLRVARIRTLLVNGNAGLLAFVDRGRVWTDGERSRVWHRGEGVGAWISLFDAMVMTATVGTSHEQTDFTVQTGFFF